jgi:hypothetical protein
MRVPRENALQRDAGSRDDRPARLSDRIDTPTRNRFFVRGIQLALSAQVAALTDARATLSSARRVRAASRFFREARHALGVPSLYQLAHVDPGSLRRTRSLNPCTTT